MKLWVDEDLSPSLVDVAGPRPITLLATHYYTRDTGPSQWLLVGVSYEQTPARIVSAFANRKDPKSWRA
jgi:hypothetical protein